MITAWLHRSSLGPRDDLTLEQILDMIIAIAKIPRDARHLEPILQTALTGLRRGTS